MLHDLLLALLGHTGDVFVAFTSISEDGEVYGRIAVADDLTIFQDSERTKLNQLVSIGFDYVELEKFVEEQQDFAFISLGDASDSKTKPSMYLRAFSTGVSEVLQSYRTAILLLEQEILRVDGVSRTPLARVDVVLRDFALLLPALHASLQHIRRSELRGGALLNHLHQQSLGGSELLQQCYTRCLWHCHQVWYRQLSGWMLHGMLLDRGEEFFVVPNPVDPEDPCRGHEEEGHQRGSHVPVSEADDATLAMQDWHHGFAVRLGSLPGYVSLPLAEAVLFIGRAVRVLRNPDPAFTPTPPPPPSPPGGTRAVDRSGGSFPPDASSATQPKEVDVVDSPASESSSSSSSSSPPTPLELLPEEDMRRAAQALANLQAMNEFHWLSLERTVEDIRGMIARHLWKLVVSKAGLGGHLQALKDYFMLARGDFFQLFFEESKGIMRLPPRPTSEVDLNVPFQQSALRSTAESDTHFENVKLKLVIQPQTSTGKVPPPSDPQQTGASKADQPSDDPLLSRIQLPCYDGWDPLELEYRTCWPLGLLITPQVLRRYNAVFQYLVRLKRVQLELEECWALTRTHRKAPSQGSRWQVMQLRQNMAHLITNLQIYFQVDVIEAEYKSLQDKISVAEDFAEVERAHTQYLSSLLSQTFLDVNLVSQSLASIFEQCLELCRMVKTDDGSKYAAAANEEEVKALTERFLKFSNTLYTCFRSNRLAGSQRAPFLRQLLLRLNYNNFYSDEAARRLLVRKPSAASHTSVPLLHMPI